MAAVVGVLIFGIVNLYKSDEKSRSRSNKLMRLRVVLQFAAILIIVPGEAEMLKVIAKLSAFFTDPVTICITILKTNFGT